MKHSVVVKKIILTNFAPLVATTGLETIEIDRTGSDNNIILILGENGSGKSFLINEITPFPLEQVNFRNSSRIVPEKDGYKELQLIVDDIYLYTCKIFYTEKKTTCFLQKQNLLTGEEPIELNPSGLVTSYYEALEIEFGLNKYYTNIGYISKTVVNFIEMKPAERNSYISTWLPNIEEYLEGYKNATKKANRIKKEIESIDREIAKISSVDYEIELKNLNYKKDFLNKEIDTLKNNISKSEFFLKVNNGFLNKDLLLSMIKKLNDTKKIIDEKYNFVKEFDSVSAKNVDSEIKKLETEYLVNKEKLTNIENQINFINNKIDSINISEFNSIKDFKEILESYKQLNSELSLLEKNIQIESKNNKFSIEEYALASSETYERLLEMIVDIKNEIINIGNINNYKKTDIIESKYEQRINTLEREIATLDEQIDQKNKRIYLLENNTLDKGIINLKPNSCNTSNCNLVKELSTLINPDNEIKKIVSEIEDLQEKKIKLNIELKSIQEEIDSFKRDIQSISRINDILYKNKLAIAKLSEPIIKFINVDTIDFINKIESINNVLKEGLLISSYAEKMDKIKKELESINSMKNASMMKDKINKQMSSYINEKEILNNKRNNIISLLETNKNKLNTLREIKASSDNIESIKKELISLIELHKNETNKAKKFSKMWYYTTHLKNIYYELRNNLLDKEKELEIVIENINSIQSKIMSRKQYEEMRSQKLKFYEKLEILQKVWSPRIGYPALLINDFLEEVKLLTNEDLKSIWNNSLQIVEFKISNNEFSIVVEKDGVVIKDASQCSDGERSTLAMAISFAILEINSDKILYNVLRFDEADGMFDDYRRKQFLNILTERLEKMNCKSCFVITHNNEFDNSPADVILLSGAKVDINVMNKKNIIFSL